MGYQVTMKKLKLCNNYDFLYKTPFKSINRYKAHQFEVN